MENKYLQFIQANDEETVLYIYGDIRKGSLLERVWESDDPTRTDAYTFAEKLESIKTPKLTVRINSNGGSVSEGLAIYNLLKSSGKKITTVCDGFAASAASIIYCAGDIRRQPKTALLLIHNAWQDGGSGNAQYFRKIADDLETVTQPSVEAYKAVSNLKEEEIKKLMDEETWITAVNAEKWGFTTEIVSPDAMQNVSADYMFNMVQKLESLKAENETVKNENQNLKSQLKASDPCGWGGFFDEKN